MKGRGFRLALLSLLTLTILFVSCKGNPALQSQARTAPASGSVMVTIGPDGFVPGTITAKIDEPLSVDFVRVSDKTCITQVVFPELGIAKDLPLDTHVAISIPTDQARKLVFQCGMGMFKSLIVIQ
jgi:plastocyanin domain-containing protein